MAVYHDFRVDPLAAGVDHIVFDREEGGHLAAADNVGRHQHPAGMADGRHQLAGLGGSSHQIHHGRMAAHHVRRIPAGDNDPVEIFNPNRIGRGVDLGRQTGLAMVGFGAARTHHGHLGAGLLEPVVRVPELEFVVEGLDQDCDFFACKLHRVTSHR